MEESTSSSSDYLDEDYARRPQVPQTHTNWNSWHGSERASLEWMASGYEWCYALLVVQARNDEMMTTTMYLETQDVEYKCITFTESRCKHCVMMDVW